jgi:peptidyl-prolyl cis-trans isomerase SurA
MKKGEISELVRSPSGYHIITILDTKGGSEPDKHFVEQTHARHILIKTNELISDDDARNRLQQLKFRIEGGESFDELARSHSQDTGSAIKGGDLGWISPGQTVPKFEQAMNSLAVNQVSEPVQSRYGWHLIQVLERRRQDNTEEFKRTKAREYLMQQRIEEETEAFIRRLRDEAYVEYRLEDTY